MLLRNLNQASGLCNGIRLISTQHTIWKRHQFLIKLYYAMIINKSQGQSLKKVGLYFEEHVFCHGQLYIALSRVTSPNGLKILINHTENKNNCYVKNIVYEEVLHNLPKNKQYDIFIICYCYRFILRNMKFAVNIN